MALRVVVLVGGWLSRLPYPTLCIVAQAAHNVNTNFLHTYSQDLRHPAAVGFHAARCCRWWLVCRWSMSAFRTMRHWAGWLWFFGGPGLEKTVVVGSPV